MSTRPASTSSYTPPSSSHGVDGLHATAARMPSDRMVLQSSSAAVPLTTSIWNVTLDAPAAASAGTSVAGLLTLK